ncbi:extracellular solute-binding protein [Paenibacillus beijingensis]|uniref:ABC transporter substrate-binding protein n=1 Tax=Paenibacillus beijingensis TaxID=1126833 RepID=A0A0D5NK15_9BACL|nr:extracellular solute-binding protein [Paenibacillus beijingensis]AJY75342.1 hypothetical protein VN24_13120 [Paenibacillus beijingensis]
MRHPARSVKVLVALLLVFLSACSGTNEGKGPESGANAGSSGTNQSQKNGADAQEEPVTIKVMASFSSANPSPADQAFIKKIEEANNVKLEFVVPPASGYQEQLQLTLVSGDYPDVVMFPSESADVYLNAVNDGILVPVQSYLEQAPNLKKYSYDVSFEALKTKQNEDIYGIPRTSIARFDNFIVRKDWLDKIGFAVPDNYEITREQFTDILRKFTFDDPDNNGADDTYGYAGFLNANKVLQPVLNAQLGYYGWQPSKGSYPYISPEFDRETDTYKNILSYTQQLYKEGVMDPDSPINDKLTADERFKRGITGVTSGFAGIIKNIELEMQKLNPNAELTYLFVKNDQGEVKGAAYGAGMAGLWSVTKNAKHPEKIVQVMDWLLSDEGWDLVTYGIEGIEYTVENGQKVYKDSTSPVWRREIARRSGDADFFIAPSLSAEQQNLIRPWINKAANSIIWSNDRAFVPAAAKNQNYLDFKLKWDETISKILTGALPVEEFDKLQEQWYQHGGKEFVEEMNAHIQSKN